MTERRPKGRRPCAGSARRHSLHHVAFVGGGHLWSGVEEGLGGGRGEGGGKVGEGGRGNMRGMNLMMILAIAISCFVVKGAGNVDSFLLFS